LFVWTIHRGLIGGERRRVEDGEMGTWNGDGGEGVKRKPKTEFCVFEENKRTRDTERNGLETDPVVGRREGRLGTDSSIA